MQRTCKGCGIALTGSRRKWCGDKCRKQTLYTKPCDTCGGPTGYTGYEMSKQCRSCCDFAAEGAKAGALRSEAARPRYERVRELWLEGATIKAIANDVGATDGHIGVMITRMRQGGWDLPYRYKTWCGEART